ncbi:MAG: serine/threonine protein kinase [bacterium]|nr:serine/threonine protein kinase [bacterium]
MIVKENDLMGKQVSNYKITGRLGKGGMATVYKAHELSLNRMVALKVLSPQLSEDADFVKRFQREAQAAAKLNHPNIVQVYAIGEEEGLHYFAMEYVKGTTLAHIKKDEGTLEPGRAVAITRQVAEALGEAHKAGLVHRDIKPSNIMLDASGKAKVADFGIAFVIEAKTKLTQAGSIIGTPEYLSPEQCEGKPVDGRSDIYSLGVTLYEVLTGRTPYEADTPVSMLMKIVKGNFPPIGEVNPKVPQPVQKLVEKMMETDPQKRYADVNQLLAAIGEVEKSVTVPGIAHTVPEPVTSPIEPHFQEKKKSSGAWAAITVAAIIVLLLGGAFAAKVLYFDKKAGQAKPAPVAESTAAVDSTESTGTTDAVGTADTTGTGETSETVQVADAAGTGETAGTTGVTETATAAEASVMPQGEATAGTTGTAGSGTVTGGQTQPSASSAVSTSTSSLVPSGPKPAVVKKARPPANSLVVTVMGDEDKEDMVTAYAQNVFSRSGFTVMDGPSVSERALKDIARYHLVVTAKHMGSATLNYYGNSTEQYTVGLTMKAIDTQTGGIKAGPITGTVEYTALNAGENIKAAVEKLASRLKSSLENQP